MVSERIFGPDGLLARELSGYEHRRSQQEMSGAVEEALRSDGTLVVEAGTGTGKTLAYLIPALASGRKVIVSTGTKGLQEQLYFKDLAFLHGILPWRFTATYMKGRANYLCLRRWGLYSSQPSLPETVSALVSTIEAWAERTERGDRAEILELPDDSPLWDEINAKGEQCLGSKCPTYKECFVTKARQDAAAADLVVVNHHLFFADLMVKDAFGAILPPAQVIIFDEAHLVEDIATDYFGIHFSNYRIEELCRDALREIAAAPRQGANFVRIVEAIGVGGGRLFEHFRGGDLRGRINRQVLTPQLLEEAAGLSNNLALLASTIDLMIDKTEGLEAVSRRAMALKGELEVVLGGPAEGLVYWWEVRGRGVFLHANPIDVSGIIREKVLDRVGSKVFTSATLTVRGSFDYIKARLGLEPDNELILESPFDYGTQALLYLPPRMPDPSDRSFAAAVAEQVVKLVERSRGRAFVLFTSYRNLEEVWGLCAGKIPYPILKQGEMPRYAILEAFRREGNAVLFATGSFWEGVDVQGEALSCVIVDKLPFASPGDPLVEARIEALRKEGHNAFIRYQVPEAVISLKQGMGRLVRTRQDRGVLALLDPRVKTKEYGRLFLASLPPCPVTGNIDDVAGFFENPPRPEGPRGEVSAADMGRVE
ncbi:MAG: ATP-dependent DNA helicase [Nitrospirota bacterium]|nr:ATP-dependent DNA helicase [Nitrospirota bacterium]